MPLDSEKRQALFKTLENKGWCWRNEFIYAPNETMWLLGSNPWQNDLLDFHESMIQRMQRIIQNREYHDDKSQHSKMVEDVESLVDAIQELLKSTNC